MIYGGAFSLWLKRCNLCVMEMFLFIPLTAVISTLIEEDMERRRLKKEAVEQAAKELEEE